MSRILHRATYLLCLGGFLAGTQAAEIDFLRDVRPILSAHCFKCHGPDEGARKARLRLDIFDEAVKPAKSEKIAIVPRDTEHSELVRRIFTSDEDDVMPPPAAKNPLSQRQKDILKKWISEGAEYKPHWAFEKPKAQPLPAVRDADWPRNGIDYFTLARLEKEGLKPSRRADKYTLIRRLSLDLTGLPPATEQVDAFLKDDSAEAYERLIDSLLSSPRYGERWARRWLDLARYADTNGYEKDRQRSMWPYRDWVIAALNKDMPFTQFTIEQLAGDMLPNPTADQLIATGFHRNTMINEEGGIDPLEYRFYSMVDRVHVTATTWLGLTMACAQCHTHKYDPIQQTEYYQFLALMNNADEPTMDVPKPDVARKRASLLDKIAAREAALAEKFPAPRNIEWVIPAAVEFSSQGGADGAVLSDGSIRVTGKNPDKDTYELAISSVPARFTHIQIEAIPDDTIGGPGRTDHGNFVLTELTIRVGPGASEGDAKAVKFKGAESDVSQDQFPVENAIDGKPATGWAVGTEANKRMHRYAIFALAEPVETAPGAKISIKLAQTYGGRHTLGRFRVSLGNERVEDGGSEGARRQKNLERQFTKWIAAESPKVVPWQALRPSEAKSQSPVLNIEGGDTIFATGDFTKSDTYIVNFAGVPAGTRAIRLEVLPDDRLPAGGPGTVHYEGPEGDFWLSNLKVLVQAKKVPIKAATESFASGGNNAAKAIDEDLQSGWSVNGGQGRSHNAVFEFADPLPEGELQLELTFEKYFAAAVGKFRIWATTNENARASAISNEAMEVMLAQKNSSPQTLAATRTPARDILLKQFLQVAPELAAERKEIEKMRRDLPKFPTTLVMRERDAQHPRTTYRHHRGEFLQAKEEVSPGVPAFLPALPSGPRPSRLTFASWLVSPENPLTARVTVNRQWEAFFGRGLVRTVEDFGFQGELPTHPELLDWMAVDFMNQGWSMKKLHKLIVMSATYQQESAVRPDLVERDPQNLLLARGPRFRLEAELVRDSVLAASGLLSEKLGGPSVFPPQPAGVSTEGAYGALAWKVSEGADRYRRGLYTFAKRTAPFAMTATFDGPSGEACLARRDRSNTPLQALTLLNDAAFMECSRALGEWAARQSIQPEAIVDEIFRRCLTRPPTESERQKLLAFFARQLERFENGELKAAELTSSTLTEKRSQAAAWTAVARVILNLDEMITKS